jgi:ABC-type multidrug transport system ATPase subunit
MGITSLELNKSFKKNTVIEDFSFSVNEGKLTFLLGPNGSGKTTWIRIALGHETADYGQVLFDGKPINKIRDQLAVVFDEPPVYPHLSGYDNLQLLSGIYNIKTDYVRNILAELKLPQELMRNNTKAFSLGQRHRLAVACALIRKAKYIIMDEPTVGLDYESWEMVKVLLKKELNRGCVILVTGHNYDLIEEIVDNLIIISNGIVIYEGSFSELKNNTNMIVKIKTKASPDIMSKYNFSLVHPGMYEKSFGNRQEFDNQLVEMQFNKIIIEQIDFQIPTLKEMYRSIIEDGNA